MSSEINEDLDHLSEEERIEYRKQRREYRAEQEVKEIVSKLSNLVNGGGGEESRAFARLVLREHRTLQQGIFSLITTLIKTWADCEKDGNFDLRNEYTVKKCAELMKIIDYPGAPHI